MLLSTRALEFLRDENGGERDTLTTLLILALIIIPLVLVIIFFGNQIKKFAEEAWDAVMGGGIDRK
jgi:hypothetical protein